MRKELLNSKFDAVKSLIDRTIENPNLIPDNVVVFALTDEEITQIITKKRLELIETIKKKKPATINKLAEMVKRRVEAVDRDIKLLEEFELISLERHGREVTPKIIKEAIILPLAIPKPIESLAKLR